VGKRKENKGISFSTTMMQTSIGAAAVGEKAHLRMK